MPLLSNLRVCVHGTEQKSPPFLVFFSLSFYFLAFPFPSPLSSPISPAELAAHLSLANHTGSTGGVFCPKWRGGEEERCFNPAVASPELREHLPVGLKTSGKQHPRLSALVNSLRAASTCFRLARLISAPLGVCVPVCVQGEDFIAIGSAFAAHPHLFHITLVSP